MTILGQYRRIRAFRRGISTDQLCLAKSTDVRLIRATATTTVRQWESQVRAYVALKIALRVCWTVIDTCHNYRTRFESGARTDRSGHASRCRDLKARSGPRQWDLSDLERLSRRTRAARRYVHASNWIVVPRYLTCRSSLCRNTGPHRKQSEQHSLQPRQERQIVARHRVVTRVHWQRVEEEKTTATTCPRQKRSLRKLRIQTWIHRCTVLIARQIKIKKAPTPPMDIEILCKNKDDSCILFNHIRTLLSHSPRLISSLTTHS